MFTSGITSEQNGQMFLQLLVTQVQYQDPLDPVDQQEFIGQLSQFSMVEGLETLNAQFSDLLQMQQLTEGAALLGRTAEFETSDGVPGQGVVDRAYIQEGQLVVEIDGAAVPLDRVHGLVAATAGI